MMRLAFPIGIVAVLFLLPACSRDEDVQDNGTPGADATAPVATLTAPTGGESWTGTQNVAWTTVEANPSTADIEVSGDSGATWSPLAGGVPDSGTWSWDTTSFPTGSAYRVRVRAIDLSSNVSAWSESASDFALLHPMQYGWTRPLGGSGTDLGYAVAADSSGNFYVAGEFASTVDFRADWGAPADSKTAAAASDVFVTKIGPDGSYGWTRRIGGSLTDQGKAVAVDASGNVYVAGAFAGTFDFRHDFDLLGDIKGSGGGYDAFVTKILPDGSYGWTRTIGATDDQQGTALAVDHAGNVYVGGYFRGTVDFQADWGGAPDSKTSSGSDDAFVLKILTNGSYGWTRRIGGSTADRAAGIAVDGSGNVFVAGYFSSSPDFRLDWGGTDPKTSAGSTDAFVTRILADGSYGWTHVWGGASAGPARAAAADASGNVFVTGSFSGTVDFQSDWGGTESVNAGGSIEVFVVRVNADGSYGWVRRFGGSSNDEGQAVFADRTGNVLLGGYFGGTVDFRAWWGGAQDNRTSSGSNDAFVLRLGADGSYGAVRILGDTADDRAQGLCADAAGNAFLAGYFGGTVDFQADWAGSDPKTSAGAFDVFATKFRY